eukprot:scaffold197239_cov34-Prasinocladus_malaysianus.AAC.1
MDEALDIAKQQRDRVRGCATGVQRVGAIEYHRIPTLSPSMPAGMKVVCRPLFTLQYDRSQERRALRKWGASDVTDPFIRRGIILLRPENIVLLGGQ